ncbi:nucleus protein [Rhodotorula toruloides]|uniref:Nucleus protein n=1 Tax=Rhodotorula toruloides TaxID=5286 RepID=A0A511K9Z3_RHOTO|nr:nucleus protein [Rhodotorula toruloides]
MLVGAVHARNGLTVDAGLCTVQVIPAHGVHVAAVGLIFPSRSSALDPDSYLPLTQYTATQFSFASTPKPFKNPHYTRHSAPGGPGKRNKTLKQILTLERERVDEEARKRREERVERRRLRQERGEAAVEEDEEREVEVVSFVSIEAPPSLMPQKRYCDITGLEAKYVDPRTLLRYHSPSIFELIRSPSFQPAVVQAYLALRGMGIVLR